MGEAPEGRLNWEIRQGGALELLRAMPAESVRCCVTSPPYWGLRDYGVEGQIGLERTPEEYVAKLVAVFAEVRRVLTKDGTLWLNLGDSYATGAGAVGECPGGGEQGERWKRGSRSERLANGRGDQPAVLRVKALGPMTQPNRMPIAGLKPKDLVGIPWRVAFALQRPYYTGRIPDERDRTWLSALMDGEGTFTILCTTSPHGSGNSYPPIAQVRMTSAGVVAKAASLIGVASPAQYPPSNRGHRPVYQWRLSGGRAAEIARELYPYLIEKRKQALIVWNHQAVRDSYETKRGVTIPTTALDKQHVCRDLIRRLNHGGNVDIPSWMVEPPGMTEPGWYLRSDVIWSKSNPMPESVTDRPTKSHEYLFLLSKSARYYYDGDAIREPRIREDIQGVSGWASGPGDHSSVGHNRDKGNAKTFRGGVYVGRDKFDNSHKTARSSHGNAPPLKDGRNRRTVWTIATEPFAEAHFATFPQALVEPCILAGSAPGDQVLDPFAGSGTVGVVALRHGRRFVGLELSADYAAMARKRIAGPLFASG